MCVNKLDPQALLFWSNLIRVFFCLCACSVKCCSPLSLPFWWGNGPRCPTVTMETPMSVNHTRTFRCAPRNLLGNSTGILRKRQDLYPVTKEKKNIQSDKCQ